MEAVGGWPDVTSISTGSIWLLFVHSLEKIKGAKREASKDTDAREDGGLKQSGSSGDGKKPSPESGHILKVEARGLGARCGV